MRALRDIENLIAEMVDLHEKLPLLILDDNRAPGVPVDLAALAKTRQALQREIAALRRRVDMIRNSADFGLEVEAGHVERGE